MLSRSIISPVVSVFGVIGVVAGVVAGVVV